MERFILASWAEYLRQRARLTVRERELTDRVTALLRADSPMRVSRLIGVRPLRDDADRD